MNLVNAEIVEFALCPRDMFEIWWGVHTHHQIYQTYLTATSSGGGVNSLMDGANSMMGGVNSMMGWVDRQENENEADWYKKMISQHSSAGYF